MGFDLKDMRIDEVSIVDRPCSHLPAIQKGMNGSHACGVGRVLVKSAETHSLFGIVYGLGRQPDCTQDTVSSPVELVKAEVSWRVAGMQIGIMHREKAGDRVQVVKSWIADRDGVQEGLSFRRGDWLMKVRIVDSELWKLIESWGPGAGYSIGGRAFVGTTKQAPAPVNEQDPEQELDEASEAGKELGVLTRAMLSLSNRTRKDANVCSCKNEPTEAELLGMLKQAHELLDLIQSIPDPASEAEQLAALIASGARRVPTV